MISSGRLRVLAVIAWAVFWSSSSAFGQAGTSAAGAPQAAAAAPLQAGFDDGFFIQTANGDTKLIFGMVAQTDGRFSLDDPPQTTDTFLIRKVRPTFTGRIAKYFEFKI